MSGKDKPRRAAAIVLFRPREDGGFEVYLSPERAGQKLPATLLGLPGAVVTDEDSAAETLRRVSGLSPGEARKMLGAEVPPAVALGYWLAAVRALFESAGVAFFSPGASDPSVAATPRPDLCARRADLLAGKISFGALLAAEGLICDLNRLKYFSHWLERAENGELLEARLFLAPLPRHRDVEPIRSGESGLWMVPDQALAEHRRGSLQLTLPVFAALRSLADFESWRTLCGAYGVEVDASGRIG